MSWRDDAACRGMNTELWFSESRRWQNEARKVCAGCPVRAECGETGRNEVGMWGGKVRMGSRRRFDGGYNVPEGPVTIPPSHQAHGRASGYNFHRCRCAECRRWSRETAYKYRQRATSKP